MSANPQGTRLMVESMAEDIDREKQTHKAAGYGESKVGSNERCDNCYWFSMKLGKTCCGLVQDPIHPTGWCKYWSPKAGIEMTAKTMRGRPAGARR
jgi:hypothetical protein